jgi:hypothetical protein
MEISMYLNQRRIGPFRRKMCKTLADFLVKEVRTRSGRIILDPNQPKSSRSDRIPIWIHNTALRRISLIAILLPELADALIDGLRDVGQDGDGSPALHAVLCILNRIRF